MRMLTWMVTIAAAVSLVGGCTRPAAVPRTEPQGVASQIEVRNAAPEAIDIHYDVGQANVFLGRVEAGRVERFELPPTVAWPPRVHGVASDGVGSIDCRAATAEGLVQIRCRQNPRG